MIYCLVFAGVLYCFTKQAKGLSALVLYAVCIILSRIVHRSCENPANYAEEKLKSYTKRSDRQTKP